MRAANANAREQGPGCACEAATGAARADSCACGHEHAGKAESKNSYVKRLITGAAIFAAGMVMRYAAGLDGWAQLSVFLAAYVVLGWNVFVTAGKNIAKGKVFDENFLMAVASAGAFALGDYMEGTAVMLFYLVGETLSDLAVGKSRRSIAELMDIRPDTANVERDGGVFSVPPSQVEVGETIVIRPGEKVPLDCVVVEGATTLNTSALTGESAPRDAEVGSELLSGFVNVTGLIKARVEKPFGESTASKILRIVEFAGNKKAHAEKFITKFAKYYTPAVCAAALCVAVIPGLATGDWPTWVYRALLFLVISCPCALVVSVPLTYFAGIGGASRRGILVKGASYIDALNGVKTVVFDKTGTLTKGVFKVRQIVPARGVPAEKLLEAAALAEAQSGHPIAKSVREAYGKPVGGKMDEYAEAAGYGVTAVIAGSRVLAGNARLMERNGISHREAEQPGTVLYVAKDGAYLGYLLIADELKENAAAAVSELCRMGVQTAMLTGDDNAVAQKIAAEAGIAEVHGELLPQDKVGELESIERRQGGTAFVGDGINDAPVLARADVGLAMGALGSDAAIEAADIVLMRDDVAGVPAAIATARKTRRIAAQNIVFALAVKAAVMVLGVSGMVDMWAAVFADVGVTIIAVLNSLRAMKVG